MAAYWQGLQWQATVCRKCNQPFKDDKEFKEKKKKTYLLNIMQDVYENCELFDKDDPSWPEVIINYGIYLHTYIYIVLVPTWCMLPANSEKCNEETKS